MAQSNGEIARKSAVAASVVIGLLLLLYAVYLIRGPLLWIGIAFFLSIAINPPIRFIARYTPRRNIALATLVFFVLLGLILLGILSLFLSPLVDQTARLLGDLPSVVNQGIDRFSQSRVASQLHLTQDGITSYLQQNLTTIVQQATSLTGAIVSISIGIINNVIALVAIVTLMFFMTVEGPSWKRIALNAISPKHRATASALGARVYDIVSGYVVGNLLLSVIFGVASALVLSIMHNPYSLTLGLAVGLLDLIPLVGATIGATVVAIITLLAGDASTAVVFAIFTMAYVQLENNVLNPAVYSKSVDVSPLIVLVALLVGGAMAGIIGALVAIPVAASIQVIIRELWPKHPAA